MRFFPEFLQFADECGLGIFTPEKIKGTGEIERYTVKGDKKGSLNGWLIFRDDIKPSCTFGSWKTGETITWFAEHIDNLSKAEQKARRKQIQEDMYLAKVARNEEQRISRVNAAMKAYEIWEESSDSKAYISAHQYVQTKKITPKMCRVNMATGNLIIPMLNHEGMLASIQQIYPNGKKMFLSDGKVSGTFLTLEPENASCDKVFICEGYATGCTVHEISECTVIICWNANNLQNAVKHASIKYPDSEVFVCADNDFNTVINGVKVNVGEEKAIESVNSIKSVKPMRVLFYGTEKYGTDWNDYFCQNGYDNTCSWFNFRLDAAIKGEPEYTEV